MSSPIWMPGIGQTGPVSNKPAGLSTAGGFAFAKQLDPPLVLARVATGGALTSVSVAARINNPAARLVCAFSLSFEPDTQQSFTNYNSAVWSAQGIRPGGTRGREAGLHSIFASQTLPQLYEIASSVRVILITATLTPPKTSGAVTIPGNWVLGVEWEPAMPMCEDEIAALYNRCGAQVVLAATGDLG